jgi:hypothetical protein
VEVFEVFKVHDAQEKRRERNFWRLCQQIGG